MDPVPVDQFEVFVREQHGYADPPEAVERVVGTCSSYGEARRVQQAYRQAARECIIRFVGPAGGGD